MPKRNFYISESEMDDFQRHLIQRRIDQSMVVSGCAGSGKSILALHKAKQIQERPGGESYSFIVFTKALNQYMNDGIRELGLNSRSFKYHHEWKKSGYGNVDYMIVDEVQDFTSEEVREMSQAARKAFFFFGDSAQQLYDKKQDIVSTAKQVSLTPETLQYNYRLPKKIARVATHLGNDNLLEERCRVEGASKPFILKFNTLFEQLNFAMEQIKNKGIEDAGILLPTNDKVKEAYEYLRSRGHAVEAKYRDKGADDHSDNMSLDFSSDNPKLMTYHSSKGLQFQAVFLPECDVDWDKYKSPLYVAITRSYDLLYVTYSTSLSPFLSGLSRELYESNAADPGPLPF